MNKIEKRLLFCFTIYVLLFIGVALYPANRNMFFERIPLLETLYNSNLIYPFIANTLLIGYYVYKNNKEQK